MEKYVLVMKKGNNHHIGIKEYDTEKEATERKLELAEMGIKMKVMTFAEACGI